MDGIFVKGSVQGGLLGGVANDGPIAGAEECMVQMLGRCIQGIILWDKPLLVCSRVPFIVQRNTSLMPYIRPDRPLSFQLHAEYLGFHFERHSNLHSFGTLMGMSLSSQWLLVRPDYQT